MQTRSNILDLRNSLVVLGSGPNALATITGLLGSKKKIVVVDAGLHSQMPLSEKEQKPKLLGLPPKLRIKENYLRYKDFEKFSPTEQIGFKAVSSLAFGGLSNFWGGGLIPYGAADLNDFPYSLDEIWDSYEAVFKILTGKRIPADLTALIKGNYESVRADTALTMIDTLLAVDTQSLPLHQNCESSTCCVGCFNCNFGIFNSSNDISRLIAEGQIDCFDGYFISNIEKVKNYYAIYCSNLNNGTITKILAETIFCSLGTLSTTRILLDMLEVTSPVPLLTTPSARFFALSSPLTMSDQRSSTVAGKTFLFKDEYQLTANIFPITPNLLETLVGIRVTKILLNIFGARFFTRLCVGNMYFPSKESHNLAEVKNSRLKLTGMVTPCLKQNFDDNLKKLKNLTKEFGYRILPWGSKLLFPGEDIHYGGTFPMRETPNRFQCDKKGLLYGQDGFYITDASSLPLMTAKPHTFNAMAQSHHIGKAFKLGESNN